MRTRPRASQALRGSKEKSRAFARLFLSLFAKRLLALAELEALTGLLAAVLLRFFLTRVARQEAFFAKDRLERLVHLEERAGDTVTNGAGLAGHTAADRFDLDVDARTELGRFERLTDRRLQLRAREVVGHRLVVDRDDALAERQFDARDRALTTAGGLNEVAHRFSLTPRTAVQASAVRGDAPFRRRRQDG